MGKTIRTSKRIVRHNGKIRSKSQLLRKQKQQRTIPETKTYNRRSIDRSIDLESDAGECCGG